MKSSTTAILIVFVIFASTMTTALAAFVRIRMPNGPVNPDSYIIVLKSGTSMDDHIKNVAQISTRSPGSEFSVTHRYGILNGYSAHATGASLARILICPEVDYVEADGIAPIGNDLHQVNERDAMERDGVSVGMGDILGGNWGGLGVDIYVLDTGVNVKHICFDKRAFVGPTFGNYVNIDTDGHGTHIAGIAAGRPYGIATRARIISVKVASGRMSVFSTNLIGGINYASYESRQTGRPSIALICASLDFSRTVNRAVSTAISWGLHIVVSAGNNGLDASKFSPASSDEAITVGAFNTHSDMIASFSNHGSVVDVFAPGNDIRSAWIGSLGATMVSSGTGPAAAYVASLLAVVLSRDGQTTPANLSDQLKKHAAPLIDGQPWGTTDLMALLW
ncbi:uncharacterized protein EI90DRAFT_3115451 [Cantharellus anzutake]|uniref:uncharacterized protein n=1 Tax=Cantharellus anzutake TaxID=1750568 RepID=UPI0019067811|nr:uncharacterized protein EI90DRAFT_3115451 [Cantharellus anzutake]KAF8342931.1 hypothetical protein EI90DRAFT_3115451 [Cantharellus anzutake]